MNNMYDILAKLDSVEKQQLNEGTAPAVKTAGGFQATAPAGKRLSTTMPKDRPLQPSDVKIKEDDAISSYSTTPGFDRAYATANPTKGYSNEVEELEDLLTRGGSNDDMVRRQVLLKKYGINKPEDLQKLPGIKAQAMKDIRGQQQQIGKDLAARNAQAAKEREAELARMRSFAGVGKPAAPAAPAANKSASDLEKMPLPSWYTKEEKVDEADVDEGNDFTKARLDAIHAGKPTFKVGGKTYKVTGDTSDETQQVKESLSIEEGYSDFFDKKQMYKKIGADVDGKSDDYTVTFKDGSRKRYQELDGRRRVTTLEPVDAPEEQDDEGNVVKRGRGRPKGSKRSLGAKGPSGRSKLMRMEEDYDKDEYDEEGEMAKSQARTIEDAARELQDILDDDENLPEWVQKKIVLAKEYIDSARDYMKANPDEEEVDVEVDDEELVAEKAVSKAQRAAAGIAYAAKKGDIPKSELRGASKEMADMPEKELKKFAKTKEKDLPEKVKEEDKDEVDETTVAGSVATAPATGKASGMFGKGIYESAFENKLKKVLNEGISITASQDESGKKTLNVSASDDDAVKLAQILQLAGMPQGKEYNDVCPACGQEPCGCDHQVDEDYANSPDTEYSDTETMTQTLAGGLNGPKLQVNPNNMGDNPLAMRNLGSRGASGQVNLGAMAEDIEKAAESRLWELYHRYQTK